MNAVLLPITISLEENLWWLISFKLRLSLSLFLSFTNTLYTEWVQLRMSEKFQLPEKLPETTNQ